MYQNPSEVDLESQQQTAQQLEQPNPFICNICLDTAAEPVITECGHLYWLNQFQTFLQIYYIVGHAFIRFLQFVVNNSYKWLNSNQDSLTCPVCKNGITTKRLIPLYAKDDFVNEEQPKQKLKNSEIPSRPPPPDRLKPQRNNNQIGQHGNFNSMYQGMNLQHGVMIAGYGYFPSIFNLLFQVGNQIEDFDSESPESSIQKYFKCSLLLLMVLLIGTLIFLC